MKKSPVPVILSAAKNLFVFTNRILKILRRIAAQNGMRIMTFFTAPVSCLFIFIFRRDMRLPKNTAYKFSVPVVLACGLGPGAALTAHRAVIHCRAAAFGFALNLCMHAYRACFCKSAAFAEQDRSNACI
ncbi:MAG: hypothetical protein II727_08100 [Oscillospiraceae bacterium]|nr:hypothetical protein [Oscillospiraceae bacterium]